jgi:hypothetical protein
MNLSKSNKLYLLPAALLLAPLALASPLSGEFGFTGPGVMVFASDGAAFIEFCTTVSGLTCSNAASATGAITVTGSGTGSFSVLAALDPGTIDSTTDVTPPTSPYTYLPVGLPVAINDYFTISGFNWNFQANQLPLASCMATSDQQCVGPFQLNQNGPNVVVTANVFGTLFNVASGGASTFDLILSGQYADTNIAAVETGAESSTGVFSDSWSGTLVASAIPEPGTLSLLLTGIALISISFIHRKRS